MSIVDKVIAAAKPPESEEQRLDARNKANAAATPGDGLSQILDHRLDIEDAFDNVKEATDPASRKAALKQLSVLLTGHSIAEEGGVYPALADGGEKTHAGMGYDKQAMVKIQMELLDKLEHIEGAIAQHVNAEKSNWCLDLNE